MATSELLLAGLLIGLVLGAVSRWSLFCTFGAIADVFVVGEQTRLRGWALTIAVALLGTQALHLSGLIDLGESFYLAPSFGWLGAIIGGFLFGLGMALVGTCSFGSLVRLGGGDLKSLVVMLVIGVSAYMTLHGPLAGLRVSVIGATDIDLSGVGGQGLVEILAALLPMGETAIRSLLAILLPAALLLYCLADRRFLRQRVTALSGLAIGLLIVAAWFATGVIGFDEFEPTRLVSLSFVRPVGDSLMYVMTSTGSRVDFGIMTVLGVILGAGAVSVAKGDFRLDSFDSDRQMLRHIVGAVLMGFGGVTALGCTIGQGMSAISALSLSAPLALGAIFLGAFVGLEFLLEGRGWPAGAFARAGRRGRALKEPEGR